MSDLIGQCLLPANSRSFGTLQDRKWFDIPLNQPSQYFSALDRSIFQLYTLQGWNTHTHTLMHVDYAQLFIMHCLFSCSWMGQRLRKVKYKASFCHIRKNASFGKSKLWDSKWKIRTFLSIKYDMRNNLCHDYYYDVCHNFDLWFKNCKVIIMW